MSDKCENEVLLLKDVKSVPDIIHTYTGDIRRGRIPIVIDNGEYYSS